MTTPACPQCGASKVLPFTHGLPGSALWFDLSNRKLVVLGGCECLPHSPCWFCASCGHSWGEMGGWGTLTPEGKKCEAVAEQLYRAELAAREQARQERLCPAPFQPWLDYLLTTAVAKGAECLVIESVVRSERLADCPTAYLVRSDQRERIEDGGVARLIVEEHIPREHHGTGRVLRVLVQDQEVLLGLRPGGRARASSLLPLLRQSPAPPRAFQCAQCGMNWRDPNHVVNTRSRR